MSSQNSQITKPTQNSPLEGYDRRSGGGLFDIIVGNPPYGAKLSQKEQEYLLKKYDFGTTETAILFILKALDLLKNGGYIGFIIPKSFCFASNYQRIRELVWDNVVQIVDCGKVWDEVKLEQIIVIIQKGVKHDFYINKTRNGEKFENEIKIDKNIAKEFGFFLNGISENDILKAKKMLENSVMLNEIAENRRGAMLQKFISNEGELEVIGGAEISRNGVVGIKGKINKDYVNDEKAYIKPNSILVQNIVAHIENPEPHIKITACIPARTDYILVDTINQITLKNEYSTKFVWVVLNSEICNWYVYNFVIGRAIRTIHFDSTTTSQLPIPLATPAEQTQIAELVDRIMELKKESQKLTDSFVKLIQAKYFRNIKSTNGDTVGASTTGNFKISTKLKHWHKLETYDFLDEVNKAIKKFVAEAPSLHGKLSSGKQEFDCGFGKQGLSSTKQKLSLSQEAELMAYFDEQKVKALELEMEVKRVDNLIENGVRDLYKL